MASNDAQPGAVQSTAAAAIANPAPLGLCAFALTTFVLSSANAGILHGDPTKAAPGLLIAVGLAMAYGGLAQLLAGMWEFKTGNTFGALAFSSYGAFWLSFAASVKLDLIPGGNSLGFFLLGWTIFTAIMFIATLKTNMALILLFGFLLVTFLLLTLHGFGMPTEELGGWFGIATAMIAWYTALAGLLGGMRSAIKLPVGEIK